MPCDQIRMMRVAARQVINNEFEVGKLDRGLLDKALHEGLKIPIGVCAYNGETLIIRTTGGTIELTIDQIKVAYSQQVVKATAKRYGWKLQEETTNAQGEPQYVYQKAR
jgi:hypothetical protein